jgi:hypothetical protein
MAKLVIVDIFLQQPRLPSLMHSCNSMKVFFFGYFILGFFLGGDLFGLLCGVLGVLFLRPSSIQDAPCPHCYGLYILSGFSRHVKGVHPHANLVS